MADFRTVNRAIKRAHPGLDIVLIRGAGYCYFDGRDGFDRIPSIYTHPTSTSTETLTRLALAEIAHALGA
jgi:hypothetical protein